MKSLLLIVLSLSILPSIARAEREIYVVVKCDGKSIAAGSPNEVELDLSNQQLTLKKFKFDKELKYYRMVPQQTIDLSSYKNCSFQGSNYAAALPGH